MLPKIREWHYARCKGLIVGHVRDGKGKPETVVKSIQTSLSKNNVADAAITKMLAEVEAESVRPFLGPPWNKPERMVRLNVIMDYLIKDGNRRAK